ncbi:MAG: hydrogenase formation protein HypD [Candidatus Aminicenantes bacterium]|nr:hydrogenase formation protein HypD [Candidatus Aminicenantes bacterium]
MSKTGHFRQKKFLYGLLQDIKKIRSGKKQNLKIMEVCGTHTMTIHRYGLKKLLEDTGIHMLSGPGCPVCITPNAVHEAAINLVTERKNLILTTFGDMTRVPTQKGSIQTAVAPQTSCIKIVYSPEESLELARAFPQKDIVFFGVGFETTIPGIALTIRKASEEDLTNFSVLSAFWLIPPPLKAILNDKDTKIDGFLYPGHVSAIIGESPYLFVAEEHQTAGAIAGFEPADILLGILSVCRQVESRRPKVDNVYSRVVKPGGNRTAQAIMKDMLTVKDAYWRGLGSIRKSGLELKSKYSAFDAEKKYTLNIQASADDLPGCRCGDVLRGKIPPRNCPLFGRKCRPDSPQGPCMVSFEGACLAAYKYNR